MAKSMTGFGKALISENNLNVSAEIKSVNQKNRDIRMHIPYTLNSIEITLRKLIEKHIQRGYVDININYEDLIQEPELKLDQNKAQVYLNIYQEIEELTKENIHSKANLLARNNNIISKKEESIDQERYLPVFAKAVKTALAELDKTRQIEGQHLVKDLHSRIEHLHSLLEKISNLVKIVPDYQKKRLLERLEALLDEDIEEFYNGQRVAAEIAIFVDKADITEEITRLESHLNQFKNLIKEERPIGKNLDFIVQEILRETNTIGSKANHLAMTQIVVEMKTTIEKIREQVQNIE